MAAPNLFQELKKILDEFKTFLEENVPKIKPAIAALKQIVPQITELIDKLIELLDKLSAAIQDLNVGAIPGLDEVSKFTGMVKGLLDAAQNLLPNETGTIEDIRSVANVVTGLPSVDALKEELTKTIQAIVDQLNNLKS